MRRVSRSAGMVPQRIAYGLFSFLGFGKRDGGGKSPREKSRACSSRTVQQLLVVIIGGLLIQMFAPSWRVSNEDKAGGAELGLLTGLESQVGVLPSKVHSGVEEGGAPEVDSGEADTGASAKEEGDRARRLESRATGRHTKRRKGPEKNWEDGKQCATVEEMGREVIGDKTKVARASLRVRRWLQSHFSIHGASVVRALPAKEFCSRKFVVEKMHRDGLGNNLYKVLSAAGVALMLNRSLIIGEHFSTDENYVIAEGKDFKLPWGDYIRFTPEAFSMREVKQLWVRNKCEERFGKKLQMRIDRFLHAEESQNMCEDWGAWEVPIIHYKDAEDFTALQCFLKSAAPRMRAQARRLLGTTYEPDSRPNTFGELMRFLFRPMEDVSTAVQWSLGGGRDPDIAVHMRMMDSTLAEACEAAARGIKKVLEEAKWQPEAGAKDPRPRIAIVSDTAESIVDLTETLGPDFEVVVFDYKQWMEAHPTHPSMNSMSYVTPAERVADWGSTPRWVAVVDFFLASRAKIALVAAARNRIATTFAQLAAGLAAANSLDEEQETMPFGFYSSFQAKLLALGLRDSKGRSHVWHTFAGKFCCINQSAQLAPTPLLPYAWFDAPLQSPMPLALQRWRKLGLMIGINGEVSKEAVVGFCQKRKGAPTTVWTLQLPRRTWVDWWSSQ